jgi:hypothetical protein
MGANQHHARWRWALSRADGNSQEAPRLHGRQAAAREQRQDQQGVCPSVLTSARGLAQKPGLLCLAWPAPAPNGQPTLGGVRAGA